jgi:hypothetical protein
MSAGVANCLICGEELIYSQQSKVVECFICGKKETGNSCCMQGHYVCDSCHRNNGVDWVLAYCTKTKYADPIKIAQTLMNNNSIYPNGPEHHTLIGASLLAAYKNAGGDINLKESLDELRRRSMQVPGGTCGFWGTCGAATSAGQFYSIIAGSTPMTTEPWAQTQRLTSIILGKLADLGGPRCCKRTGFTAIKETVKYVNKIQGIKMDLPDKITCTFYQKNKECLKVSCPYFPKGQ